MEAVEKIIRAIKKLQINPSEMRIYRTLHEKGEMTVREIADELQLSTRIVRMRLKKLVKEGFVKRRIIKKGWIGYVYFAEKPEEVVKKMKEKMYSIISGSEEHDEKNE